jgi:hypothetical protein
MKQFITYIPDKKKILVCPKGISFEQMEVISKSAGSKVSSFVNNEKLKEVDGISDNFDEELVSLYPDYQKLVIIKNPYWRILQSYLWNFLYNVGYKFPPVKTFKQTIKSLYFDPNFPLQHERLRFEMKSQKIDGCNDFFITEDFENQMESWFNTKISSNIPYNSILTKVSSNYHESMSSLSEFYDRESAEIIYEEHETIFEKFNYSFYSYLDFHSPLERVHHLHGDLVNKFES